MSHFTEREEKNCLNCGAVVYARYCHLCAQENVEPKESFGHLVTHFVYDVTHFDGKFFSSVKYLLFKPGFLSAEYIRGKRMSYLNPIKMYVFISAFFFLFFFTVYKPHINTTDDLGGLKTSGKVRAAIESQIKNADQVLNAKETPEIAKQVLREQRLLLTEDITTLNRDTSTLSKLNYFKIKKGTVNTPQYRDVQYYDSLQSKLPVAERDNWLKRIFKKKKIELDTKYSGNKNELLEKLVEKFLHSFPQILFISLPLFALILKLLYIRRKNYFYADHIIYTVHLYCATFILLFFSIGLTKLSGFPYLHWLTYLVILTYIYSTFYQYKSMRNFYKQGRAKTIFKMLITLTAGSMLMMALFTIFLIFSLFSI